MQQLHARGVELVVELLDASDHFENFPPDHIKKLLRETSFAPLAAIRELRKQKVISANDRVVAVVTASGLKDLDRSTDPSQTLQTFRTIEDAWQSLNSRQNMFG